MGPRLLSPAPGWEASGAEFPQPISNSDFEVQRASQRTQLSSTPEGS